MSQRAIVTHFGGTVLGIFFVMAFQGDSIYWVEVEKVVPNPFQPRREFDPNKLQELADSIRMYGVLQPLTVTRKEIQRPDGTFYTEYELIAGERRLRASKLAQVSQVPVIIREGEQSEQEKLELAIIENLQREDLNSVDRALAFRQLADVFGLSHSQVATKVGRSREYVSNSIRLLALPDYMLNALRTGDMSEGHGRTLLMLNDRPEEQDTVFREILLKKLSVREVERIARSIASEKIRKVGNFDADLVELEKKFTETLGTRVSIVKTEFGGRLSIDYFTAADLEQILERMKIEAGRAAYTIGVHIDTEVPTETALGAPLPQSITTPIHDELLVLTNSTGLELVPEETIAEPEFEEMSMPVEIAQEKDISEIEETESVTAMTPEPAPVLVSDSIPQEKVIMAEPELVVPEAADQMAATPEALLAPIELQPVTPETVETSNRVVATPEIQEPIAKPVETEVSGRVSLRDQLAQLLRQSAKPVVPVASMAPVIPVPTVEAVAVVRQQVEQFTTNDVVPTIEETSDSDNNLYDLKNFSI